MIRKIVKPENHKITVQLPDDFEENNVVEVIVLSVESEIQKPLKISRKELFGKYKGQIWISPDFNEPLDDFKEYMELA